MLDSLWDCSLQNKATAQMQPRSGAAKSHHHPAAYLCLQSSWSRPHLRPYQLVITSFSK